MKPEMVREYASLLDLNDRDGAVRLVVGWLERGECSLVELYEQVLLPGLSPNSCHLDAAEWCLWRDRIRNSITRTVVEACRPFVLKEAKGNVAPGIPGAAKGSAAPDAPSVIVVCPRNETSDAAGRIYSDFFALAGARADFVGTDVPCDEIAGVSSFMKADAICLIVDNPFNLTTLHEHCESARKLDGNLPRVLVAGRALDGNSRAIEALGATPLMGYADVVRLVAVLRGTTA